MLSTKCITFHDQQDGIPPPATISHLPAEVLLDIFCLVYWELRVPSSEDSIDRMMQELSEEESSIYVEPELEWIPEDPLKPSFFPYALANVCRTWRSLLGSVPQYWTRLRVYIDDPCWHLSDFQDELHWSRNLPFELTVLRNPAFPHISESLEDARVRAMTELLPACIDRCTRLSFDLTFTSVLPLLSQHMHVEHDAKSMECLHLTCDTYRSYPSSPRLRLSCVNLHTLVISGYNIVVGCRSEWFGTGALKDLTIYNYSPLDEFEAREELEMLLTALSRISGADNITLRGINLDCYDELESRLHRYSFSTSRLVLEDLSAKTLLCIFDTFDFDCPSTQILRCGLPPVGGPTSHFLNLEKITDDGNLAPFLLSWHGYDLVITDCQGFTDNTLRAMTQPSFYQRVHTLYIRECHNFSVAAMKRFVKVRYDWLEDSGVYLDDDDDVNDWPEMPTALSISKQQLGLTEEDVAWFRKHVKWFM